MKALQGMAAAYRGDAGGPLLPRPYLPRPGWAASVAQFRDVQGFRDPEGLSDEDAASLWPVRCASQRCLGAGPGCAAAHATGSPLAAKDETAPDRLWPAAPSALLK